MLQLQGCDSESLRFLWPSAIFVIDVTAISLCDFTACDFEVVIANGYFDLWLRLRGSLSESPGLQPPPPQKKTSRSKSSAFLSNFRVNPKFVHADSLLTSCATKTLPLPEKILPELFLKLPLPDLSFSEKIKKFSPNYFEIAVARFELSERFLKKCPIPSVFVWVAWHYPPKNPVIVEFFVITDTRFEIFRIDWVMFAWQMVLGRSRSHQKLPEMGPNVLEKGL